MTEGDKPVLPQDRPPPETETGLLEWLRAHPADAVGRTRLGQIYFRQARHEDAAEQFLQVLEFAPDFAQARWMLAGSHAYRGDWKMALGEVQILLRHEPERAQYLDIEAYALLQLGEGECAISRYEALLAEYATAENWKSYGRALKAVGRTGDAIEAYRRALALKPDYGMVWWSLAELKSFRFQAADIDAMHTALQAESRSPQNRALLHFTLARACEDDRQYETAFQHYSRANAAVRSYVRHDPAQRANFVQRNKGTFTPEYFRTRAEWGCSTRGPIFILGLPRSGSTLIEQILASHSEVEPTAELQALESVVRDLGHRQRGQRYPDVMQEVSAGEAQKAGEDYLARAAAYRRLGRTFFIDKMPNNFSYLGAILTFLPNAKIIDARRHPLGSGLAIFKHYFVEAYSFAFDLDSIGRYYRNYVELMAHFDAVQPARVHRVLYEDLVAAPEREINRLLEYCGLEFEAQCLRFHENTRAVLTPSSEQVRQPISAEGATLWRNYERWLNPLKSALGDVLERYPGIPEFL